MKLQPRPALSEKQLREIECRVISTASIRDLFSSYRRSTENIKAAARKGDKEAYDRACKHLEERRERIDWLNSHGRRRRQ